MTTANRPVIQPHDTAWPSPPAASRCQVFETPDEATRVRLGIADPDLVLGCLEPQGDGPSFFYVPVPGVGAVRVGCCPHHLKQLKQLYTAGPQETP